MVMVRWKIKTEKEVLNHGKREGKKHRRMSVYLAKLTNNFCLFQKGFSVASKNIHKNEKEIKLT